jgi:hypothetical protein
MILIFKIFGTYVSFGNLDFPQGKFIVPWGSWFFPREKEFKLPWGAI